MSNESTPVLCPIRPEEQLTLSSSTEGGVQIREHSVLESATELADDEGEAEEEARTAKQRSTKNLGGLLFCPT